MRLLRLNAKPRGRLRIVAASCVLLQLALAGAPSGAQNASSDGTASLQVSVCDTHGRPLAGAIIHLQTQKQSLRGRSDGQGRYRFTAVAPGTYTVRAEMAGYSSAESAAVELRGAMKTVKLTLSPEAGSKSSSGPLQYFDEPQFTIAGVTDTSNLGGHGSNATAPAKDALTREVASMGGSGTARTASPVDEEKLRRAAEQAPEDFEANRRLGTLLVGQGQAGEALRYLQQAARVKPGDEQNSYELALAYSETGDYERARSTLQPLLAAHGNAEAHHLLGDIEEKQGNSLDAVRQYERAATLDPSEANLFDWGAELLLHRATEPAIEVFSKGHRLFPKAVRMLLGLGAAWFVQGSYGQAAGYFCQASDLDPEDPNPYVFLGKIQEAEAAPSAEISQRLARFVRLHPENAQANYYYGMSQWKQAEHSGETGKLEGAEALLQKAARLDSGYAAAYLQLGRLYAEQKRYAQAISYYEKAIAADAHLRDAHYRLAQAYMRSGEAAKARTEMQVYDQLSQEEGREGERERRHMQQFVYTLRKQDSASQAR